MNPLSSARVEDTPNAEHREDLRGAPRKRNPKRGRGRLTRGCLLCGWKPKFVGVVDVLWYVFVGHAKRGTLIRSPQRFKEEGSLCLLAVHCLLSDRATVTTIQVREP